MARADAVLDFWALLHRQVVIRSLVLEDPEINLVSDPDGPWNFENPETKNSKNTFPLGIIDKVVINRQLIASNLLEPSDAPGPMFFEAHNINSESLLSRLRQESPKVLVQDWFKDVQSKSRVRSAVESILDKHLPESYSRTVFTEKCNKVFHVILNYASQGLKWAA